MRRVASLTSSAVAVPLDKRPTLSAISKSSASPVAFKVVGATLWLRGVKYLPSVRPGRVLGDVFALALEGHPYMAFARIP